jgi:hypothetical protein
MKSTTSNNCNQKSVNDEVQNFYNWLLKTKNVFLYDNERIVNAFEIVTQSHKSFMRVPIRKQIF